MRERFSEAAMEPISEITQIRKKSLADSAILSRAIVDSFRKLKPRTMAKNPVMFVVEVGAVVTTIQLIWNAAHHAGHFGFGLQITLWLWFTVLFANFAEAMRSEERRVGNESSLQMWQ